MSGLSIYFVSILLSLLSGICIRILFGCVVRKIMFNKGYTNMWFWCGFFLGVIGIIVALVMPDKENCHKDFRYEADSINEYNDLCRIRCIRENNYDN